MRRKVVAGNWKMNISPSRAGELIAQVQPQIQNPDTEVVVCVPAIDIVPVMEAVRGTGIKVGAENMYYEENGAFTGELSAEMLTDAGVTHVILGHSERRQYFHEDNEMINRKVRKAIEYDLTPIICCGETLEQREQGVTMSWIKEQITSAFADVSAEDAAECIVAYEPIWAIGTGKVATSEQAQEVCAAIRQDIAEIYGDAVAQQVRILYGGSVNAKNASEIFSQPDIDGGLVGGASLKPEFAKIVNLEKTEVIA